MNLSWIAGQVIPRLLRDPYVHYYNHKNQSLGAVLDEITVVHTLDPCFKICFNVVSRIRLILESYLFPSGFPIKMLFAFLIIPKLSTFSECLFYFLLIILMFGGRYKL
jgi:hypothetical protein